jgi:hypothetical protein
MRRNEEESSPRREAGVGVAWRPWRRAGVEGEEEAGVGGGVEGLAFVTVHPLKVGQK